MPRTATRAASPAKSQTALEVLKADHAEVKKLFTQFEKMKKNKDKTGMQRIAQTVCKALTIHARIEEEIFYPALRETASADMRRRRVARFAKVLSRKNSMKIRPYR